MNRTDQKGIMVIEEFKKDAFEKTVNELIKKRWKVMKLDTHFMDHEDYQYRTYWVAMLIKEKVVTFKDLNFAFGLLAGAIITVAGMLLVFKDIVLDLLR